MTDETVNIGPKEIAKFLSSLRKGPEEYQDLINRAREEFDLNPDQELLCSDYDSAVHFIDFLEATEHIRLDAKNAKPSEWYGESKLQYILTKKGREFIPQYL